MMECVLAHPYQSGRFGEAEGEPLRPGGLDLTRRALEYAAFGPGQRVLDLGCGDGAGTALLRRHGCETIGVDLSPDALNRAAQRLPGMAAVAASAHRLPFADAALDGVLAECSLSLAGYTPDVLGECRRVLRPGGRLAIADVYARAAVDDAAPAAGGPACLAGMAERDRILAALAQAGFAVTVWEDHSKVLAAFLARLIFAGAGPDGLWAGDAPVLNEALRARRPGYFLLTAVKTERRP